MALTTTGSDADGGAQRALTRGWVALLVGMAAAGLHLPISYALVKWACSAGHRTPLVIVAAIALAAAAAGAALAWPSAIRLASERGEPLDARMERSLLVARIALGTNLVLALFILLSSIGPLVLSPCA